MRILHTADWHIRSTGDLEDKERCLDHLIGLAAGCDVITIGGDIFEFRGSNPTERLFVVKWFQRLREVFSGPVLICKGNHDRRHDLAASLGGLPGACVYETPGIVSVTITPDGESLVETGTPLDSRYTYDFLMLPWPERSGLANYGLSGDQADQTGEQGLIGLIKAMIAQRPDQSRPLVGVGHLNIKGAKRSETQVIPPGEISIGHQDLRDTGASCWLLGHIHKPQQWGPHHRDHLFDEGAPVIYSGSLTCEDHGEEEDVKGVVIADVSHDGSVSWRREPLPARKWMTAVATNDATSWTSDESVDGAVVRYQYHCKEDERHLFDESSIEDQLLAQGAHRVTFDARIERIERVRDGAATVAAAQTNEERLRAWGEVTDTEITDGVVEKLKEAERGIRVHGE